MFDAKFPLPPRDHWWELENVYDPDHMRYELDRIRVCLKTSEKAFFGRTKAVTVRSRLVWRSDLTRNGIYEAASTLLTDMQIDEEIRNLHGRRYGC